MRIGFDAKRAFSNTTGLGNYSRTLISSLLQQDIDADFYLFSPSKNVEFTHFFSPQDPIKIVTPQSILGKTLPSVWRSIRLGKPIREHKIDLYHGLSQELPVGMDDDVAKVVTIHDLIFLRHRQNYNRIDIATYTRKAKYACEKADIIIAISEQTKQDIINFFHIDEKKIRVIYQDCDERFKQPISEEKCVEVKAKYNLPDKFLLSVGALTYRKNNLRLIQAIQQCDEEIHLCLAGIGEDLKDLKNYVLKHQLEHRVHFLGYVPNDDLPILYKQAYLFVYPSLFEGFGIPILEAFHTGTPVMVGGDGCFPEVGGEHAIYVDQTSPDSIAEKIRYYWHQPEELEKRMQGVQKHVQKFNHKKITEQVLDVYNQALAIHKKKKITYIQSPRNPKKGLSALVITKNEENNIRGYLDTVSFANEIIVVDSFSTDKTVEIIKEYPNVKLLQRKFDNFSSQKNYAIQQAYYNWILFIDTDERIDKDLQKEILFTIHLNEPKNSYYFYRRFYFKDKVLNYSGWQHDKAIRLLKNIGLKYAENKLVHEQIDRKKPAGYFKNKLDHYSLVSEEEYAKKLDLYAKFRAKELARCRDCVPKWEMIFKSQYRYFKHYIWQLGFLDGKEGKAIARMYRDYVKKRYHYFNRIKKGETI